MALPPEFVKQYGLEKPKAPFKRRLVLVGYGEKATGKTDFGLRTMPRPLLHINLDKNTEGLEEKYIGKDITFKHVHIPVFLNQEKDKRLILEIRDLIMNSMDKGYFRSYEIDTGDKLYMLVRRGIHGSLDFGDVPQSQFAEVNNYFFQLFNKAKETRSNFYMGHHMKDERKQVTTSQGKKGSVPTGGRVLSGWSHVLEPAQCVVKFYKDLTESGLDRYKLMVEECNANPDLEGNTLSGEEINFLTLGKLVFANYNTTDEEWL